MNLQNLFDCRHPVFVGGDPHSFSAKSVGGSYILFAVIDKYDLMRLYIFSIKDFFEKIFVGFAAFHLVTAI